MTNITARKGLAFGALVALGSTLLAGAPAHAAAGLTLAPVKGTSYAIPAGYDFQLQVTASSEIPADRFDEFKFKITNVDGKDAYAYAGTGLGDTSGDWDNLAGAAGSSQWVYGYTQNNGTLWISSEDSTVTSHYTVTAWLDANNDSVVDAGELQATQTVTFLKAADLTATTKLTAPIYADESDVSATATLNNINIEQWVNSSINDTDWWNDTRVKFNVDNASPRHDSYTQDVDYNTTDKNYQATQNVGSVAKNDTVSAQVQVYIDGAWTSIGSASTTVVLPRAVSSLVGSATATTTMGTFSEQCCTYYENYVAKNTANAVQFTALAWGHHSANHLCGFRCLRIYLP